MRTYPNGAPKAHQGWDFAAAVGTTAYAIADGSVEFVACGGDYGRQICIEFEHEGKTYHAFYAHMQHVFKQQGDKVSLNDEIGATGKTGNAANLEACEEHLHFEIRTKAFLGIGLAHRVSPLKIFKKCPLTYAVTG